MSIVALASTSDIGTVIIVEFSTHDISMGILLCRDIFLQACQPIANFYTEENTEALKAFLEAFLAKHGEQVENTTAPGWSGIETIKRYIVRDIEKLRELVTILTMTTRIKNKEQIYRKLAEATQKGEKEYREAVKELTTEFIAEII